MRRREDALSPWHYPPLALRASASLINRPPSCPRPGGCTQPRSNDSEKKKKEGKREKGERKSKSVKMKNYRDPFERTRLEEASTRENRSNFPRKMFPSLFFASPLFLLSPPLCRAPPSSRTAVSISGTEGKFDPAIIVFPEIEGTVVAGNGDRLTELWLSLSSHHCHATLNSRMGGEGRWSNKKPTIFALNRQPVFSWKIGRDYCQGNR